MFKIISIGRKRPFFMEYCKIDKKVQFRYNKRKLKKSLTSFYTFYPKPLTVFLKMDKKRVI